MARVARVTLVKVSTIFTVENICATYLQLLIGVMTFLLSVHFFRFREMEGFMISLRLSDLADALRQGFRLEHLLPIRLE